MRQGQLYIGVAIIIAAALAGVYSSSFSLRHDTHAAALEELCTHFRSESYLLINTLIEQKSELTGTYYAFVRDYVRYARSTTSSFGVTTVLYYHNTTTVTNMLDASVTYTLDGTNKSILAYPQAGHVQYLARADDVRFSYAGEEHNLSSSDTVDVQMLCTYRTRSDDRAVIV